MASEDVDVDALLQEIGFDPEACVLTRRQAEILALRERDVSQREIAERLGTSRANVSSIESSARRNVRRAEETVDVAEALAAPVRVAVEPGTDLFDVPGAIYSACDDIGTKVPQTSAALVRQLREEVPVCIEDHIVVEPITIGVGSDGTVTVQAANRD